MTTKVQKWGNSLAIRIPKFVAETLNLRVSSRVILIQKAHSFEIRPVIKLKHNK